MCVFSPAVIFFKNFSIDKNSCFSYTLYNWLIFGLNLIQGGLLSNSILVIFWRSFLIQRISLFLKRDRNKRQQSWQALTLQSSEQSVKAKGLKEVLRNVTSFMWWGRGTRIWMETQLKNSGSYTVQCVFSLIKQCSTGREHKVQTEKEN